MIRRVLKNKLIELGYAVTYIENKIREFNFSVDTSQYTESDLQAKIKVIFYDKPTTEIPRFFLNVKGDLVDKYLFEGNITPLTKFSVIGSQISLLDYCLSEKVCLIGVTAEADIYIIIYLPSREVSLRYMGKTYEDIFSFERENLVVDYLEALTAGNRLSSMKAKDILYVLLSEFVIDTILVENSNPRLKLYDNASKFAENITNYEYKYINRRINRIEFVEKYADIKITGFGITLGTISNNPYLVLKDVNEVPDFYLNRPTYVWFVNNGKGQEEIAIYTSNESYVFETYREMLASKEDTEIRNEADKLTFQFSNEMGYQISRDYIFGVMKKLNRELLIPPVDFIKARTAESYEFIEPLRYRFSIMKNRKEFEGMLYNSIDDNINGRYKYRFVEKLSGIYTTIGNKLNYTDENGKYVKKQSVADFNINFNAAIIKRETLIDGRSIPQLMGYMYKDIKNKGTDMLPVPSIEVIFNFPEITDLGKEVEMYNGTEVEIAKGDGFTSFYEIGANMFQNTISRPKDPNEKFVIVKYINSNGEILKENIVRDVMVGGTFVPELLPVISDKEGKEWICEPNQLLSLNISPDNSKNEIDVKYIKKVARVRINHINRHGAEIGAPIIKNMQVGEVYDMDSVKKYVDVTKTEWSLYQSKPSKLIVSEDDSENVLTLVYDVVKADVIISFKTRDNKELKPQESVNTVAYKDFTPKIEEKITDENGLVWKYAQDSKSTIYVEESSNNRVVLTYDELKKRVITRFVDEKGQRIKDDVLELVQVGKNVEIGFEQFYIDSYNRNWKFSKINNTKIKVSENEQENIFIVTYERVLANIYISMVNDNGQKIREDIIEQAQIGAAFSPNAIKEIEDQFGKAWVCLEEEKSIVIKSNEMENKISYKYKPLMTSIYTQYVDLEGNQLLPQKEKEVQVGSLYTPEFISTLQGQDQRVWTLSENNLKEYKIKKHKEENIIKINYDKKLTDVILEFKDIRGNTLKPEIIKKAQLGSEMSAGNFYKITSDNGERWMITKTEPARMFVRENSKFILVYDEIKAKVIVRCVNEQDDKPIVDDVAYTTKLGGVYVPKIEDKIFDRAKHRWKYVGEPGMSIITKENEQENILVLKYEQDKANVTIKYLNKYQQMIHKDVINAEQIGTDVAIKEYEKIFEENGFGWKLKDMSRNTLTVDEDENKNIVICNYEALMVPVTTKYIDEKINEITASRVDNIQVGEKFNAKVIPEITDDSGKVWVYSDIKVVELTVKDDTNNKVNIKYIPLKKKVTEKFVNNNGEELVPEKQNMIQVGKIYTLEKKERVTDGEERAWIYQKSTVDKIKVSKDEEKNIITNYYEKELTKVTIKYQTVDGVQLDSDKVLDLQIGSNYDIERKETLEDKNKLLWKVSGNNKKQIKISRNSEENIIVVTYEKYMVNVYDKYINEVTNEEIIKPTVSKQQVGSSYLLTVKDTIIGEDGKHWVQAAKSEIKIFTSTYKVEPITVVREEARNVIVVKYKPKLIETIIKYQDPLGKEIKPNEVKKLQIGTTFSEQVPSKLVDNFGNKWTYNPNSNANVKITENPRDNVVVLAYEEQKGTVTFRYLDKIGNDLKAPTKKLIQIGNTYVPQFDTIINDSKGCVWEYSEREKEKIEVKENDSENVINLIYMPLNVNVELTFEDLWGNEITEPQIVPAQLGSDYKPTITGNYTNKKSLVYRLSKMIPEKIKIKEIPIGAKENPNKFKLVFEPITSDITIIFQDLDGNILKPEEKINMQVGSKYKPEPVEFIKDKKGNQWQLANAKTDEITVLENAKENIIKYVYEVAKSEIIIRYINIDGLVINPEKRISAQVGSEYVPSPDEFIFDKEHKKWKLFRVQPVNLHVGSLNNIVTVTYQEEKTKVTWEFCDEKGNILKPSERYDVQIGYRYTPIVKEKIIYDASQIWRLLKIEPYEIIISENANENKVKLIYSNTKMEMEKEVKPKVVNPFAENVEPESKTEEVKKEAINSTKDELNQKHEPQKDIEMGKRLNVDDTSVVIDITGEAKAKKLEDKDFEFTDSYLIKLARGMSLDNVEKRAINELNTINAEIIQEFRNSKEAYYQGKSTYDYSKVEKLILKEKEMIKLNLDKLISNDKSGARLLKIFEHIVASESNDLTFGKLQQRKALQIADYFVGKPLTDMDKVLYICERGKNTAELKVLEEKMQNTKIKNVQDIFELKTVLYYEKLLLDYYYKARNSSTDNYFVDSSIKETTLPDVVIGVTNLLVEQALKILRKENINFMQRNEVEAIVSLCTPQQINSIKIEIDKYDGKTKRNASKTLQEILKRK